MPQQDITPCCSLVPALSIVIGIPIVGEIPNGIQITGLLFVTIGLMAAIGAFRWRISSTRSQL